MTENETLAAATLSPEEIAPFAWRINKPVIWLKPGQYVTFDPAGMVARLWLPNTDIFVQAEEITHLDTTAETFQIRADAADGYYPYGFYLAGEGVMVEGNSPPYIQIKKTPPTRRREV